MDTNDNLKAFVDAYYTTKLETLRKTVEELKDANAGLAEEVARLEKENTRYKCVIEAIESRINKRRADIQEITKRLHQATMSSRAALKYSKEMESCLDQEEHYADTVY